MCPSLRSFQPTRPTDLIQLGLLFGPDALPKTHSRSTIQHYFTTLHSLTSEDCATIAFVQWKLKPFAPPWATQIRTVTTTGRMIMRFVVIVTSGKKRLTRRALSPC